MVGPVANIFELAVILIVFLAAGWMFWFTFGGLFRLFFRPKELPEWARDEPTISPARGGFPVIVRPTESDQLDDEKPGVFRVVGVNRTTSEDVILQIPAITLANAKVKAELQDVIVTRVSRVEPKTPFDNPLSA